MEDQPSYTKPPAVIMPTLGPSSLPETGPDGTSHRGWYVVLSILGLIELGSIALYMVDISRLHQQAEAGVSGTEFIALSLTQLLGVAAAAGAIGACVAVVHIVRNKPRGLGLAFSLGVMIPSLLYASYITYAYVSFRHQVAVLSQQGKAHVQQLQQQLQPKTITVADASNLLSSCQIHQFYYGANAVNIGENADTTSTGVLITYYYGNLSQPWRISAGSRTQSQLLPIAQAAAQKCGLPLINRDN